MSLSQEIQLWWFTGFPPNFFHQPVIGEIRRDRTCFKMGCIDEVLGIHNENEWLRVERSNSRRDSAPSQSFTNPNSSTATAIERALYQNQWGQWGIQSKCQQGRGCTFSVYRTSTFSNQRRRNHSHRGRTFYLAIRIARECFAERCLSNMYNEKLGTQCSSWNWHDGGNACIQHRWNRGRIWSVFRSFLFGIGRLLVELGGQWCRNQT